MCSVPLAFFFALFMGIYSFGISLSGDLHHIFHLVAEHRFLVGMQFCEGFTGQLADTVCAVYLLPFFLLCSWASIAYETYMLQCQEAVWPVL